jgi:hypothetical protein
MEILLLAPIWVRCLYTVLPLIHCLTLWSLRESSTYPVRGIFKIEHRNFLEIQFDRLNVPVKESKYFATKTAPVRFTET